MEDIDTKTIIYNYLASLLSSDHYSKADFSNTIALLITSLEDIRVDRVEIVDVALDYSELFDVYLSIGCKDKRDKDFVICKKGLPISELWHELHLATDALDRLHMGIELKEFYYWLFRINKDGTVSPTAIAKEFGQPRLMTFKHRRHAWKYSYYLDEPPTLLL